MDRRPMLATPSTETSNRAALDFRELIESGQWAADVKLDGIRAFAQWDGASLRLINRNGVDITAKFPELSAHALILGDKSMWLDGEIIADDGRFETALTRDKQEQPAAIERAMREMPCRFMAFDLPDLADDPWHARRDALEKIAATWEKEQSRFGLTIASYSPKFLDITRELGLEGVIAKRTNATYQFGARSKNWVKFKNLHRITCVVTGYTAGTGARSHFGAMHLALIAPNGEIIPCGRVGTGFDTKETHDLKERLDRHEVLIVEIECLNRTSGNQLRFPVYKGIRTDVDVLAASTLQLDTLPAC